MIDSESLWELVEHASIKFDHLCIERPEPSPHAPANTPEDALDAALREREWKDREP
jgi:hypothetical protein